MNCDSYYEMKLWNEVDIFIVFDNVLLDEFVIEDMKIFIGYVRICLKILLNVLILKEMLVYGLLLVFLYVMLEVIIILLYLLFYWCIEIKLGEICFLLKKLCKVFVELVFRVVRRVFRNGFSVN